MASPARTPYALALVLCDAIHRDPVTGKYTLLGTFSTVTARAFPATHAAMSAYVALTDGGGAVQLALCIVPADGAAPPIAEVSFDVDFDDPRMTFEVVVNFPGVVFPSPGEYRVRLACSDEIVLERRLIARSVGKGDADA